MTARQEFRPGQVRRIDTAFRELQQARGGRDARHDKGSPRVARAKAVLARAVGNSSFAERGAWASDANDRLATPRRRSR